MAPTRVSIERILCPTDFSEFSERALSRALSLASWFESRVTVLHATGALAWGVGIDGGGYIGADFLKMQREKLAQELGRLVEPNLGKGVPIETTLVEGDPASQIQSVAEALPADLVVLGTHGRTGFQHLLLGSVAERVLRTAPCPVLTVGKEQTAATAGPLFRRILCAADLTKASERTLHMALSVAEENLARLTLLHVVEGVLGEAGPPLYRPVPESAPLRRALVYDAKERLESAARSAHSCCDVSVRVETGSAWRQILRIGEETYADLIVVGAHAHGAFGRLFLGSTANQVVRHARCPVLIVRETMCLRGARENRMAVSEASSSEHASH
jgi:nucleotide-binding universal stress UspA family protein